MTGVDEEPKLETGHWIKGMNDIVAFFTKSLQVLKVFKKELRDGRKLRTEVEIASEIQKHALEHEETIIPSLEIAMATAPASEVGGDSLDIITGKDGNYYMYVGDVTGHGVPSGFVMMMTNALISAFVSADYRSSVVLAETNRILKPRIKQNMMMTCIMLRWNEAEKKMYYTGAGHEHLLVYKAKANQVFKVKSGGVALGMVRDSSKILKEMEIQFEKDDIVVLYTDGISEARYRSEQNGILFGVDRIVESIMKVEVKTSENIFRQITIDLSGFMYYRHKQYDDITLLVARFVDAGKGETQSKLFQKIDPANITEWNWGLPPPDQQKSSPPAPVSPTPPAQ